MPSSRPLVFGHRGARGHAPENTLESFRLAGSMKVDGVEFDVHLSKDGQLVVIHDDRVDRTTNGSGPVRDFTLARLKELDAGAKSEERWRGARIPTPAEVFAEVPGMRYKIELKHGGSVYPGIEEKLLREIERAGVKDSVRITSFDYDALERVRSLDRSVELGMIIHGRARWFFDAAKKMDARWLQANYGLLEPKDVALVHGEGLKVGAWGLAGEGDLRDAIRMGVDDITSDYPDEVLGLLGGPRP
ncbi:MAG: glycerophosphodiester phosphodiesterase [Nitrososphaerota archaeon]|nr:glycerophosphodiester phosphodiesterase [Nitrososphaerota archaeon]MDG6939137.1 glycerophosphodiester phosphodiesterase [Nitrososphaerota archaeon]